MAGYNLTTGQDDFPGTPDADTFSGPAGGNDALNGAGGDDIFTIHGVQPGVDAGQRGTIDGGTGTDTVVVLDNQLASELLSFSNVEILDLTNVSALSAGVPQVNAFSTILVDSSLPEFSFDLYGGPSVILPGEGTLAFWSLDFSTRFASSTLLKVSVSSAGVLVGTDNADELRGGSTTEFTGPAHYMDYGSSLSGVGGNDRLVGSGASDHLDGGTGADYMEGGYGGDTYFVDNVGDTVVAGTEGATRLGPKHNKIYATISIDLTDTTHFQGPITEVVLQGTSGLNATGSSIDNALFGNSGSNILDGGAGNDRLEGGAGDDTFLVDGSGDQIIEAAGGGTDKALASKNYALTAGAQVERVWAADETATIAQNLYGNEFANHLIGNAGVNILDGRDGNDVMNGRGGNDTLYGRLGNDILAGGQGNDAFFFNTARNATTNVDRITDFTNATGNNDSFRLDDAVFGSLPLGVLAANRFHVGAGAHDTDDRIIYNQSTGDVFFDPDGNKAGGIAATKFAHVDNHAILTNVDFVIV